MVNDDRMRKVCELDPGAPSSILLVGELRVCGLGECSRRGWVDSRARWESATSLGGGGEHS